MARRSSNGYATANNRQHSTSPACKSRNTLSDTCPNLLKELELKNPHQVPKLEKIVVNIGLGGAKDDKKIMEVATNTLRKITGQQPVETIAKNSIAGFKLREGNKIGLKVTLRGERMYEFTDRLITIVLPRLRDFHGVSPKAFDKQGNYSSALPTSQSSRNLVSKKPRPSHGLQVDIRN